MDASIGLNFKILCAIFDMFLNNSMRFQSILLDVFVNRERERERGTVDIFYF